MQVNPPVASTSDARFPLVELTDEQEAARVLIQQHIDRREGGYVVMHGFAGSGKTTVLARVASDNPDAAVCTLSGKAADVLRRKMGRGQTIHSLFYLLTEAKRDEQGRDLLRFSAFHERGALRRHVVLLDECSMINGEMARDILSTGATVVACGDPGQLPPVEGTQFFTTPNVTLQKIHRQAKDSPIIRQAHFVRLGRIYRDDPPGVEVVRGTTAEQTRRAEIVLCWRNKTREVLNAVMRRRKGVTERLPQPGEPVMCLKNAPDFGVFNGGIYPLTRPVQDGDVSVWVQVQGEEVQVWPARFQGVHSGIGQGDEAVTSFVLAYAITVHKAQGSEWDHVILVDEYKMQDDYQRWLYTGLTRAAKSITVVMTDPTKTITAAGT